VAVDAAGNIYIADRSNNRIRKVDTSGNISTVAGDGVATFAGDGGAATSASLNGPFGVAVDAAGNIYIADSSNHRIRKLQRQFSDVTSAWGVGDSGDTRGAAWGDYDADGDLDLYAVFSAASSNILYRNDGSSFYMTNQAPTVGSQTSASWADYDGDGDLDLYVGDSAGTNLLYQNDGSGSFTDVAASAGVQAIGDFGGAWADFDRDGDLDLFTSCIACANGLYVNDGSGSFTDAATAAGVANSGANSVTSVWGDYNNDGWLDLYVNNTFSANNLYKNDGDGTFTDIAVSAGVDVAGETLMAS